MTTAPTAPGRVRTNGAVWTRFVGVAFLVAVLVFSGAASRAEGGDVKAWAALRAGGIVVFRHANAPGGGDPSGMALGDCSTQRNLDEAGRAQASRIGRAVRGNGVRVERVLASLWCRTTETAEVGFPGLVQGEPAFNSFFDDPSRALEQTNRAREILLAWRGPGALVVVTHQVNIQALTGLSVQSGEGVVLEIRTGRLVTTGRVKP